MKKSAPHRGILITFEGTEGAGKTTLIQALTRLLEAEGHAVTATREPGGSQVAEQIRSLILDHPMAPWTEAFLYEAARAEHLSQTILPGLRRPPSPQGHVPVVLCDRFTDSTLAYQGMARGLDWKTLKKLNSIATAGLKPHLTVFVDIDPAQGLKDAKDPNRFEAEGVEFQTRVRKGFLKAIREDRKRFIRIRARSGTPEEMATAVLRKARTQLRALTPKRAGKKGAKR